MGREGRGGRGEERRKRGGRERMSEIGTELKQINNDR